MPGPLVRGRHLQHATMWDEKITGDGLNGERLSTTGVLVFKNDDH